MKKSIGARLAVLSVAALVGHGAMAAGYRLRTLAAVNPSQTSLAHVLAPSGLAVGEATVTQQCPMSQWVACLVDGHTDKQPRAMIWGENLHAPLPLRCLEALDDIGDVIAANVADDAGNVIRVVGHLSGGGFLDGQLNRDREQ